MDRMEPLILGLPKSRTSIDIEFAIHKFPFKTKLMLKVRTASALTRKLVKNLRSKRPARPRLRRFIKPMRHGNWLLWCDTLTLIVLGEVKVDFANFVLKLQTKFLCIGFFSKNTLFLQKRLLNLFKLLTWCQKTMFDVNFDVISSVHLWQRSAFCSVLLLQTTRGPEKSCQSGFQSVSDPGPRRVRGVAGCQSGQLSCSF